MNEDIDRLDMVCLVYLRLCLILFSCLCCVSEDIDRLDMVCLVYLRLCLVLFACLCLSVYVILLPWFLLKFVKF